ncbi:MAG: hypothetical protein IT379_39415 [Deltaproteobacteria bacterium]|nr:hypothetical protein [Deltaproteobacteria bacterium]
MPPDFTDERLQAILRGRRDVRRVPFPGADSVALGVRILLDVDLDHARIEAQRYVKKLGADLDVDPELLDREIERQVIWRAFVVPDDPELPPFFPSDRDVRVLDSVTVRALFNVYREHQEWVSPLVALDEGGQKALIDALGKGLEPEATFSAFDANTLRRLCLSMASQLRANAPTSKSSSSGSPSPS